MDAQLPLYRCHKVVRAAKIVDIRIASERHGVYLVLEGGAKVFEPSKLSEPSWAQSRKAEIGGYYVVYDDGYTSYSPATAFEAGYTRIEPPEGGDS